MKITCMAAFRPSGRAGIALARLARSRRPESITDSVRTADLVLTADEFSRLDAS
jgi:hypothetical protein